MMHRDKFEEEKEFSIKRLFAPLTTLKAIHWIVVIGLIIYANMLFNGFVWDDNDYILNASVVHSFNLFSFFGSNIFNNTGQYRPLSVTYFATLYNIFGPHQFFFHITQLTLHIIDVCLVFFVFKSFFNKNISFFLAILFLVHPMQIESVSYIASSDSPLFFLFGITALLLAIYRRNDKKNNIFQYILLLSSILVKETGVLFLPVIILYKFFIKNVNIKLDIIYSFFILIIYFFTRIAIGDVSNTGRPMIPIARLNLVERLMTIPQVIYFYIKTSFYPATLAINQQWVITKPSLLNFYLPLFIDLLFFMVLAVIALKLYKKKKESFSVYLFFLIWYLLGIGLHSQIIPLDATVADKWVYFEMVGLAGVIGVLIQISQNSIRNKIKYFIPIIGIIILILFSIRTIIRNNDWTNPVNLWTHDIKISDNYLSEEFLSVALMYSGRFQEAIAPAQKSIDYFPSDLNYYNLGYIYETLNNLPQAKQYYTKAYYSKNYIPWNHRHYLSLYIRLGKLKILYDTPGEAKNFIIDALKDYPDSADLYDLLAVCNYKLHNKDAALSAEKHALTLSPDNTTYQNHYDIIMKNQ